MELGIHFGLPEAEYHAFPALSASGIKNLRISSMDFWARSAWLNPDYENEPNDAQALGTAYHKRILEGRDAFYAAYAPALDPADYPEAIRTVDEIKERLKHLDEKVSGNKHELMRRLCQADPSVQLWHDIEGEYREANEGKTIISPAWIKEIEIRAAMIEMHPTLKKCFTGGMPEVSVFWEDPEYGVPMKCRFDYLKPKAVVDLKTFGNRYGRPIDRAIATEIANYRYYIQTAVYLEGAQQAERFCAEGRAHGDVPGEFLSGVAANPDKEFLWVFQQTGIAPVARGKMAMKGTVLACANLEVRGAMFRFKELVDKYGTDPWVDDAPISVVDDTEIPSYATE